MRDLPEVGNVALGVVGVSKSFFETPVLGDVTWNVQHGEVHCLVGGNGSGKSTLVKILSGVHHADTGTIRGPSRAEHDATKMTPATAKALGIHTVHQESSVFPMLSVAENMMLGRGYPTRAGRINWRAVNRRCSALLERFGIPAAPGQQVAGLSPAVRALIAIARALQDSEHASDGVLILDEPTATLAAREVEVLMDAVRGYAADGQAIVLVTHRLEEVLAAADRVTVLRDGAVVATVAKAGLDRRMLAELIVGHELAEETAHAKPHALQGPVVLETRELTVGPVRGLDLTVRAGEVVGIASLMGGGGSELLARLFGLDRPGSLGGITLDGTPIQGCTPRQLIGRGVALIPQDRGSDASFAPLSVMENLTAGATGAYWRRGRMTRRAERADAVQLAVKHGVRPLDPRAVMSSLSGGNQQKVILARWLRRTPRLLLLSEPTQGVDIGARADIHQQIRAAVNNGAAAVLASTDLDELLRLSDRIIVISAGVVVAERPSEQIDRREIVTLMNSTPAIATHAAIVGTP